MNSWEIASVLDKVECLDFEFQVKAEGSGHVMFLEREEIDHVSGLPRRFAGRQYFIPADMTADDLVRTCLVAILAWTEHEIREQFSYNGVAVFDPHFAIDAMTKLVHVYTQDNRRPDPNNYDEYDDWRELHGEG